MSKSLRRPDGTFAPGHPGMGGRPIGARSKLTETALQMLGENFALHGEETIELVRKTKPAVYLQCVCSLLPKQVQTEKLGPLSDITDEELQQIEELLRASRARTVREMQRNERDDAVLELALEPAKKVPE